MAIRPTTMKPISVRGRASAFAAVEPRRRGTTAERGYDADWKRLRDSFLKEHPLCQCIDCDDGRKRIVPANVVNHIEDIAVRPDLRLDWSNLQSMSKRCHDRHTKLRQLAAMRANRANG